MQLFLDRGADRLSVDVTPAADPQAPFFAVFPAMGVPARYYGQLVERLSADGSGVAVADLRGTGDSLPKATRAARYAMTDLADDVGAVLAATAELRAGRRTFLLGHSLGGHACVIHLARCAPEHPVDGLILIASGLPHWRLFGSRSLGVLGFAEGIRGISALLGHWPGWGFGGRQSRGVIQDWAHTARRGEFATRLGVADRLGDIGVPVLAISVDTDQYTPPPTIELLAGKLTGAKVTRVHVSAAEAGAPLDHFRWAKSPGAVVERITAWLPAYV
ncbi:alpha/beta fold hydrolase [Hamadaea sp.]|uniref:alpha/beta hydrolase family protein n=1 Tax=Hamadaea sp. TaxID=2024425 RepID=UPI0025BA7038|nr:alpha/beta fold hydrolase [Hamadaea sp.]